MHLKCQRLAPEYDFNGLKTSHYLFTSTIILICITLTGQYHSKGYCYLVVDVPMIWTDAERTCTRYICKKRILNTQVYYSIGFNGKCIKFKIANILNMYFSVVVNSKDNI